MTEVFKDSTSHSPFFELVDSTTGLPKTGILYSDVVGSYVRNRSARAGITMKTLASASAAFDAGGFILVDDTNQPGVYRIDVPDAAWATGAEEVIVTVKATGCRTQSRKFTLVNINKQVAILPNAANNTSGGVPILTGSALNYPVASVTGAVGSVTGNVGGNVSGSVGSVAGNVSGSVSSVVGNVGGNVNGNVNGNVVGSTGSVTGAVGSVTGAVGSVTGNVGGSVTGDVQGKILGGGAGVITGDGVKASSVSGAVGSVTGSVGSVTGSVGSVTGGVGGDVAGKILGGGSGTIIGDGVRASSVTGAVGSVTGAVGSVTGDLGGSVLGGLDGTLNSYLSTMGRFWTLNDQGNPLASAYDLTVASNVLTVLQKIASADHYIDKGTTPWNLVFIEAGTGAIGVGTELLRKKLKDVDGNNITDTTTVLGQDHQ